MITVELWGGAWDGTTVVIPEMVDNLRVHETREGEVVVGWYVPAGVIKRGTYVYVVKHAT